MKELGEIIKGFLLELVVSLLALAFLVFAFKDVYFNGFEAEQLKPYSRIIWIVWSMYGLFILAYLILGSLFILRLKRKELFLGFLLGWIVNLIYEVYFLIFLRDYLS